MTRLIAASCACFLLQPSGTMAQTTRPIFRQSAPQNWHMKKQADSFATLGQFDRAASLLVAFIWAEGGKVSSLHWYDAACYYSRAGQPDSALRYLQDAADKGYSEYAHLAADTDLEPLHGHRQWSGIAGQVNENRFRKLARPNREAIMLLDSVMIRDQGNRWKLEEVARTKGRQSAEYGALMRTILHHDSLNRLLVDRFLRRWGWPGKEEIGEEGGIALFLVIQHSPVAFQRAHYDYVKAAVANNRVHAFLLCYLDDRLAVSEGKPQPYGTQLGFYKETEKYFVYPVADAEHLDARRAGRGLEPMADYVRDYKIHWSLPQYYADLPAVRKEMEREQQEQ